MRGHNFAIETPNLIPAHKAMVEHLIRSRANKTRLFDINASNMKSTYKLTGNLEAKSIRRGALQTLAQAGIPITTLMLFSGHAREQTLLRYLNWGTESEDMQRLTREAGICLIPNEDEFDGESDGESDSEVDSGTEAV